MKICLLFLVSSCFHITHQVPCKERKKTDEVIEEQATLVNTNVDSSTTVQQSVSTTRVPQISAREPQTRIRISANDLKQSVLRDKMGP